jgi:hypothetical protein
MKLLKKVKKRVFIVISVSMIVLLTPSVINKISGQYIHSFSGTVKDETGEPIAGVTVICTTCIHGHGLPFVGTVTDLDGYYLLTGINHMGHTFQFSCVGYKTTQVLVNQYVNDVVLEEDD